MFKIIVASAILSLGLLACKGADVPIAQSSQSAGIQSGSTVSSGFKGLANIGPTCGGAIKMDGLGNCTMPYAGKFDVQSCSDNTFSQCSALQSFDSDDQGNFKVDLAGGFYLVSLHINSAVSGAFNFPKMTHVQVVVAYGAYTDVTLNIDSGIRIPIICPMIECAAPPSGCGYVAPVAINNQGCAISCGTLQCATEI